MNIDDRSNQDQSKSYSKNLYVTKLNYENHSKSIYIKKAHLSLKFQKFQKTWSPKGTESEFCKKLQN